MTIKAKKSDYLELATYAKASYPPETKLPPGTPDIGVDLVFLGELFEDCLRAFYTSTINYDPFEKWMPLLANFPVIRPAFYGCCLAGIFPTVIFTILILYIFLAHLFVGDLIHSAKDSVIKRPVFRFARRLLPESKLSR